MRPTFILFGLVWVLLGAGLYFVRQVPAQSPSLNFAAGDATTAGLYSINANGSGFEQVLSIPVNSLAWSDEWLLFRGFNTNQGVWDFYRQSRDGDELRKLPVDFQLYNDFTWSPDGEALAFGVSTGSAVQIFRVSLNTFSTEQLTFDGTYKTNIVWLDGWVYFWEIDKLLRVRIDGSERQAVDAPIGFWGSVPHKSYISPNGRWLASGELLDTSGPYTIFLNRDTTNRSTLRGTAHLYHWSPDSNWMVYWNEGGLYRYRVRDGWRERIWQSETSPDQAVWSPSGDWIAVANQNSLYKIRADGSDAILLHSLPKGFVYSDMAWAPPIDRTYVAWPGIIVGLVLIIMGLRRS